MERARDDSGQYADGIDPDTVKEVFDAREDAARPITAGDVVEVLGIARRTAHNKLNALVERGTLDTRKVGARGRVWWIPDRRETPRDAARSDPGNESGEDADGTDGDARPESDAPLVDAVERVAEEWDGIDERLDARKAAARAVLEHAREHGTVSKQVAKEEIRPEYPVEGQNARTWYRKTVRPVLNEAAEYDSGAKAYRLDLEG